MNREAAITQSWNANADAWTTAVRRRSIESRRLVTDQAIIDTVLACQPKRVLDLGCGEGWLVRALAGHGIEATGVDGSPALIRAARANGGGRFEVCGYDDLTRHPTQAGTGFDTAVANFALLQEHLTPLLQALGALLTANGNLIIQTVHPQTVDQPEQKGWREEHFQGFEGHWQVMPWYYRTQEAWNDSLRESGFSIRTILEPAHPETQQALSLIVVAGVINGY